MNLTLKTIVFFAAFVGLTAADAFAQEIISMEEYAYRQMSPRERIRSQAEAIDRGVTGFATQGRPEIAGDMVSALAERLGQAATELSDLHASSPANAGLSEEDRLVQGAAEKVFSFSARYASQLKCGDMYWAGLALARAGQAKPAETTLRRALQMGRTYAAGWNDARLTPHQRWRCERWKNGSLGPVAAPVEEGELVLRISQVLIGAEQPGEALNFASGAIAYYPARYEADLDSRFFEAVAFAHEALGDDASAVEAWRKVLAAGRTGDRPSERQNRAIAATLRMESYDAAVEFGAPASLMAMVRDPMTAAEPCRSGLWSVQRAETGEIGEPYMVPICARAAPLLTAAGRARDAEIILNTLLRVGFAPGKGVTQAAVAENAIEAAWEAAKGQ